MVKEEIAQVILRHLSKHPDAGDTVEGIVNWWVRKEMFEMKSEGIVEVIDKLTMQGFLIAKVYGSAHKVYFLNKEKMRDISQMLEGLD
ncbi:MAG: hypothetical protein HYR76_08385 [Ignavibacteria bacterium]|nr:hypothetical protein [Ignavibacteria bacterium]